MKSVIAFLAIVGFVGAISYRDVLEAEWEIFKMEYKKNYVSEEEELLRKYIFYDNKRLIDNHNKRYAANEETYEMGVNQFTDMLHKEFRDTMLGSHNMMDATSDIDLIYSPPKHYKLPESVDWRSEGAVTRVKNQGQCGSCWAFSAVGALESHHFLKTKQLIELSEQNLVDCSSKAPYNNGGCNGGVPLSALQYVIDNGGIDTESSYPYNADQSSCKFSSQNIGATARDIVRLEPNDETVLANAVALKGPISVAIFASENFQHYENGVFNDESCNKIVNHGVVVVGYGHDSQGGDFWLVKNSWGESWGERGYIRMSRNKNNQCQIASSGIFPLV